MIRGNEFDVRVYDPGHIQQVLDVIKVTFPRYFSSFAEAPLDRAFREHIQAYQKEYDAYREYMDQESLEEFDYDPNSFKSYSHKHCPIIRRCLMSQDEVMKDYKQSFYATAGRELLDAVRNIARFGAAYVERFDDTVHESATSPSHLGLEPLNEDEHHCIGVVGYGIQSSLLYGIYCRHFAHRSQNAVWALYFLSDRKDFELEDASEFLMVNPDHGTAEQNYFYPAQLFGFYSLQIYLLLKSACKNLGIDLFSDYRYIYLSKFCDHVADLHRSDILTFKRSSADVEAQPWF